MRVRERIQALTTTLAFVVSSLVALALLFPLWLALLFGRIRVRNYGVPLRAMRRGAVVLIANHPSLIETLTLPALFWWWTWLGKPRWRPWSIADALLFGRRGTWLYPGFRCLPVHRKERAADCNTSSLRQMLTILHTRGVVIGYPEGGRTCKGKTFHTNGTRVVRACDPNLVRIAKRTDATIIPVWIDHGLVERPESFGYGYYKLLFCRMTIAFGEPVTLRSLVTGEAVANALLHVGRTSRNN